MHRETHTGGLAMASTLAHVLAAGRRVDGRGGRTLEVTGASLSINDPTDVLAPHEDFRPALAVAEALHLISGVRYGQRIRHITADLGSARWAPGVPSYGERLRDQLPALLWKLAEPASRQAVALIWRPDDIGTGREDYLCGVGVQFLLRTRLEMVVTMRSTDAWHGLPYNLFAFAQLQCTLATCLGVRPGRYVHQMGSLHLYERHWEKARRAIDGLAAHHAELTGVGIGPWARDHQDAWLSATRRAAALLQGVPPFCPTTGEERLLNLLTR